MDTSSIVLPSNSTYTGTLAGILAGRAEDGNVSDEELELSLDGKVIASESQSTRDASALVGGGGKTNKGPASKVGKHRLNAEIQRLLTTRKGFEMRREEAVRFEVINCEWCMREHSAYTDSFLHGPRALSHSIRPGWPPGTTTTRPQLLLRTIRRPGLFRRCAPYVAIGAIRGARDATRGCAV